MTHMLIHRIIVTKARGRDGRLSEFRKRNSTVESALQIFLFSFLYALNLKIISGLMQGLDTTDPLVVFGFKF